MSFPPVKRFDEQLSTELTRRVALIGSLLAVQLLAISIIVCLAQFTAWRIGRPITLNPWYSILVVDLFIVILSAALAQYADTDEDDDAEPCFSPRAAGMTCFMVSIGTLAPIASYATTIWRKLAGEADYQSTFLSAAICQFNEAGCHQIYFFLVASLALTSILVATWAAHILRQMGDGPSRSREVWSARTSLPLGLSVCLFSTATLFHQGWDVRLSESAEGTQSEHLGMIVALLVAALCFCWLSLVASRTIGRRVVMSARFGRADQDVLAFTGSALSLFGGVCCGS
jgi:hypothetical protein